MIRRERLKSILVIVGILLTILGFFLDHSEEDSWVTAVFASAYGRAIDAFEYTWETGTPITTGDPGFRELATVCRDRLSGAGDVAISSIQISKGDAVLFKGEPIASDFLLRVALEDGRSAEGLMADVRPDLRERYLEVPLYRWSLAFVLSGVGIIVLENFVLDRLMADNHPDEGALEPAADKQKPDRVVPVKDDADIRTRHDTAQSS